MSFKLDLHTHSTLSRDGGITTAQYQHLLNQKILDYVAVTDHNQIETALSLRSRLGPQIIVGEEIMTPAGEVIGLFLNKYIPPHQSLLSTLKDIRSQAGLVYIPHPQDPRRHGLSLTVILRHLSLIDLIEVYNARRLPASNNQKIAAFAQTHHLPGGAGSDAHSAGEIGRTYSLISAAPTASNLPRLLGSATYSTRPVSLQGIFAPALNRLKKIIIKPVS